MAKICSCGNKHCCHGNTVEETIVDEKSGIKFIREICSACGRWLADKLLN